ncbi:MAG: VOC family protein [Terriglobales bacterium]
MNRVVHFEFAATEPERAAKFYQEVFGWQITKWQGPELYWLVTTGPDSEPGINGGILRHQDGQPRTVNTIEVGSVDDFAAKVTNKGGEVVVPKMAIPGVGYQAYCKDTEGNLFGLHQFDPSAK